MTYFPGLVDVLQSRSWEWRNFPFPHVVACDVFVPEFYSELDAQFRSILAKGLAEKPSTGRFTRNMPGYDAYGLPLRDLGGPFALFQSRSWHDVLASVFDVEASGHINGGLHHHGRSGADGWVHNDLNPGWFSQASAEDEVVLADNTRCNYMNGSMARRGRGIEVVRAVTMILYLANDSSPGGTGLYATADQAVRSPSSVIPPHNNSLLAFECTPYSFHAYVAGGEERNSFILWLHRSKSEVVTRWGAKAIRYWEPAR